MTSPDRYTGVAIALHWLLAALVLGQIAFGWYLQEVPRGTPARTVYVNLHKSTGLTVGVLILFRLYWRLTHKAPIEPEQDEHADRQTGRRAHPVPALLASHSQSAAVAPF